jgi:hypothetical protein
VAAAPRRIQLRRTKGWRKPPDTVIVARPSRWGNPFPIGDAADRAAAVAAFRAHLAEPPERRRYPSDDEICAHLRGRDLACWCPPTGPCHGDVLLEIANG